VFCLSLSRQRCASASRTRCCPSSSRRTATARSGCDARQHLYEASFGGNRSRLPPAEFPVCEEVALICAHAHQDREKGEGGRGGATGSGPRLLAVVLFKADDRLSLQSSWEKGGMFTKANSSRGRFVTHWFRFDSPSFIPHAAPSRQCPTSRQRHPPTARTSACAASPCYFLLCNMTSWVKCPLDMFRLDVEFHHQCHLRNP